MSRSSNPTLPRRTPRPIPAPRTSARALSLLAAALLFAPNHASAFAPNKEMVQLQTQVQQLQDAVARLQQSNDERMGVMKDLVQQSADSVNRLSVNLGAFQKQVQTQQDAQNGKIDQVSGQIQSLNDSLDELKTRLARLEKLTQSIQNQQQSMNANMSANLQNLPQGGAVTTLDTTTSPPPQQPAPTVLDRPLAPGKKGKPSAMLPGPSLPAMQPTAEAAAPPVDELYKTALGDYMSAKYALAATEFSDVARFYPENALAGNAFYYQAEIDYRAGKFPNAIKNYDKVLEQYPDSNKVPVAHLHKGQALIALKQNDAGARELRALIQRFPNSPEAMSARSKLNGLGIPIAPKRPALQ